MDLNEPPPEIGPHEGRELELMLSGEKPLAYFSELTRADFDWPDAEFEPHVRAGRIVKKEFLHIETLIHVEEEVRSLYFALPEEEWRIGKAHANRVRGYKILKETDEDAREMGKLLGYSEYEIEVFVRWSAFVKNAIRDGDWTPPRTPSDAVTRPNSGDTDAAGKRPVGERPRKTSK